MSPERQTFASDRVWIDAELGCWLWLGAIDAEGYARISQRYGHRASYELVHGAIPDGLHIDHLCRMRACINPDHLEAVSQAENNRRSWEARKTQVCKRGHDLSDPSNVYMRRNDGTRRCRPCALLRAKRQRVVA